MDLNELQHRLITAAKNERLSAEVPAGFEKRLMARIRSLATADYWGLWARGLWRAAAPCIGITLLLAAWSLLLSPGKPSTGDFSQEFENTVLAATDLDQPPADSLR